MTPLGKFMSDSKLTDEALAALVGCDRSYINKLRQRKRAPSLEIATKLEEVTGLPASSFAKSNNPQAA